MIDTRCGLRCERCSFKESQGCKGCIASNGKPFHGECSVAECCQEKEQIHCGECREFPCKLLIQYSNDPVHGDNPAGARIEQCRQWSDEVRNKTINGLRINNYQEFYRALLQCGFTIGGANPEGIFSLCSKFTGKICWHTEDSDTDPWEWRMRVLDEQEDIAYSKVFLKKSGYITKEWIPYFLSVRRKGESLEEAYLAGTVSNMAKRIYELIEEHKCLAFHDIKKLGKFSKEDNYRFEKSIIELQMKMYITMCGRKQKTNRYGEGYGWNSTVFCTTEDFWGEELCRISAQIKVSEAEEKIREHILILNPYAEEKKIRKFIYG